MKRIAWPLPPLTLLVPGGLVLAAAFGLSLENFGWRPEWPATSVLAHEHLSIAGPVAAAAAFHRWATLARPAGLLAAARLRGTEKPEHWVNFLRVWAVCAVAYTIGLLPIFIHTAISATYGGPAIGSIVLGYLGLGFAVAIGQFVAGIAPMPVLTVFVAVLVFLLFQLPQVVLRSFGAVLPVQWDTLAANEYETPASLIFRAFALLATAGAMVMASRLGRTPDQPGRTALPAFGAVGVLAAFLVAAAVNPPARLEAVAAPPLLCQPRNGIEVCVHAAHEADLPELADTVSALAKAYGGKPAAVRGVYDAAAVPAGGLPNDYVVVGLILDQTTRDTAGEDVAAAMAGYFNCARAIRSNTGDRVALEAGMARANELARWLRHQAGIVLPSAQPYEPPPSGLFAKSPEEIQAWLAANNTQVATCQNGRDPV
ncbi:hypothetical protein JOF56_008498 [Kibdelosporangium banguiense]|uniref:Uncharacterized protein n=1 Tax=Kibdelosporangium banguiense TaxID=1365924 RepID=A0ABS4TUL9_9PSEU|nr:hypothetical protein [Kibdelosporangium banguiense]MBP2328113.1 hypothetical protein [Kibdelosporangium banguiense]